MSKSGSPKQYVSLRRIAEICGVSRMTISRAFDPAQSVKPELRQRILDVAAREGYRPDRLVTEVMTNFARSRRAGYRETLAALWWVPEPKAGAGYFGQIYSGLNEGAEFHGCRFDHFYLTKPEQRQGLARVLKARGIRSVVVTPPMGEEDLSVLLPWDQFTAVAVGRTLRSPMLHRTQHNHQQGACRVLAEVARRRYRKPVLVVERAFDQRVERVVTGAFLGRYPSNGSRRIVYLEDYADTAALVAKILTLKPDVIVAESAAGLISALNREGSAIHGGLGFVSMSVGVLGDECAGIVQQPHLLASAAVDLLLRSRWRGETGSPEAPMMLMTAGEWNEGKTLRSIREG